ncbi:MAG: response regulator [Candidatus Margulisiibacteriota bacterium]
MKDKAALLFVITEDESVKNLITETAAGMATPVFVASAAEAIEKAKAALPFAFVIDYDLKSTTGLEVFRLLKTALADLKVIMLSANNNISLAVSAAKMGVDEFLKKPLQSEVFFKALKSLLDEAQKISRFEFPKESGFEWLLGNSPAAEKLIAEAEATLQDFKDIIIISGEGIDGPAFAQVLHHNGRVAKRKIITLDLLSFEPVAQETHFWTLLQKLLTVKEGALESEENLCGMVLLNNFDMLAYHFRHSILDFLKNKARRIGADKLDKRVRLVLVASGQEGIAAFEAEGLLEAFNVIRIPPLHERKNDLPLILSAYIQKYNSLYSKSVKFISTAGLDLLFSFDFPGNYRQLEAMVSSAVLRSRSEFLGIEEMPLTLSNLEKITLARLAARRDFGMNSAQREFDRNLLDVVFEKSGKNLDRAAQFLSLPRTAFLEKLG